MPSAHRLTLEQIIDSTKQANTKKFVPGEPSLSFFDISNEAVLSHLPDIGGVK